MILKKTITGSEFKSVVQMNVIVLQLVVHLSLMEMEYMITGVQHGTGLMTVYFVLIASNEEKFYPTFSVFQKLTMNKLK